MDEKPPELYFADLYKCGHYFETAGDYYPAALFYLLGFYTACFIKNEYEAKIPRIKCLHGVANCLLVLESNNIISDPNPKSYYLIQSIRKLTPPDKEFYDLRINLAEMTSRFYMYKNDHRSAVVALETILNILPPETPKAVSDILGYSYSLEFAHLNGAEYYIKEAEQHLLGMSKTNTIPSEVDPIKFGIYYEAHYLFRKGIHQYLNNKKECIYSFEEAIIKYKMSEHHSAMFRFLGLSYLSLSIAIKKFGRHYYSIGNNLESLELKYLEAAKILLRGENSNIYSLGLFSRYSLSSMKRPKYKRPKMWVTADPTRASLIHDLQNSIVDQETKAINMAIRERKEIMSLLMDIIKLKKSSVRFRNRLSTPFEHSTLTHLEKDIFIEGNSELIKIASRLIIHKYLKGSIKLLVNFFKEWSLKYL